MSTLLTAGLGEPGLLVTLGFGPVTLAAPDPKRACGGFCEFQIGDRLKVTECGHMYQGKRGTLFDVAGGRMLIVFDGHRHTSQVCFTAAQVRHTQQPDTQGTAVSPSMHRQYLRRKGNTVQVLHRNFSH